MDVERIQKINNLALDLMKQGLASSREDAIAQAEKVFKAEDSEEYTDMRERMEESKEEKKSVENADEGNSVTEDLSQEKVKDILEQNTKFIVKKINEFQKEMNGMKKEFEEIRSLLKSNRVPTVKELFAEEKKAKEVETAAKPELSAQTETPVTEAVPEAPPAAPQGKGAHPRSGDYKDEDVSVEKIFYTGNK